MRNSLIVLLMLGLSIWASGQVAPSASKAADLQLGASFDLASPDYGPNLLRGFGFYGTLSRNHWGIEADFRQMNDPNSRIGIYERNYEVGPRYSFTFDRIRPYVKFMVGRGVFNFPPDPVHPELGASANLAYTFWAGGFGADYRLRPTINVRFDYEYQNWPHFPVNGLTPQVATFGVAYHFK